jgi:hypothetical protein
MAQPMSLVSRPLLITRLDFCSTLGIPTKRGTRRCRRPHLTVPIYVPDSGNLFPGTDIKGVVVTYRESQDREPIGTFTKYPELNSILHSVSAYDAVP